MKIPFVDLKAQYKSIKNEIDNAIKNVIDDCSFIKGEHVEKFESNFAKINNVKHCISCANGTDAIYITLKSLGIGIGDEVITVANTWISTAETISQTGAKPVFVDINKDFYTIDVKKIEEKITKKTKAIIPVHLYGQSCDMDALKKISEAYGLYLVEDCAQAHLSKWKSKNVGSYGVAGTFSFFPGKNLGAYGDAGAIITNDDDFAVRLRMFANHGALIKHKHLIEGVNSRLDGIQAAILNVKLKYIKEWTKSRLSNAKYYNKLFLKNINIHEPQTNIFSDHVFHLYVIRVNRRDNLADKLTKSGVGCSIHYPTPLPYLKAYSYLGHNEKDFPIALEYSKQILSLPMYPELSKDNIENVVRLIDSFYE